MRPVTLEMFNSRNQNSAVAEIVGESFDDLSNNALNSLREEKNISMSIFMHFSKVLKCC